MEGKEKVNFVFLQSGFWRKPIDCHKVGDYTRDWVVLSFSTFTDK